jgi:hypothetical protein
MTVTLAHNHESATRWMAQDLDDKWRIGRLITENGKRFIVQNGIKYQVKPNTRPQVYK